MKIHWILYYGKRDLLCESRVEITDVLNWYCGQADSNPDYDTEEIKMEEGGIDQPRRSTSLILVI